MIISSAQNSKIKLLKRLYEKASARREEGLVPVEGFREISLAIKAGHHLDTLFHCPDIKLQSGSGSVKNLNVSEDKVIELNKSLFESLAYREASDGMIALFQPRKFSLSDINLSSNPFVIILEAVEKPGNLGAILRTADAAKVDALIICDTKTDIYNPNVIRSSIGCLFTVQTIACNNSEVFQWLREKKITPYAAALSATKLYYEQDFNKPSAIVMGTEADGLSPFWLQQAEQIKIPMRGEIDSLNVSVCAAILTFEAMRQRGFSA